MSSRPISGDYLLDTNIVSAILDAEPGLKSEASAGGSAFVPSTVVGELYYGAEKSGRRIDNLRRVERYVTGVNVIPVDHDTGRVFAQVKLGLRRKGRMIPENDIWIAAVALQYDVTLITRDGHFNEVTGLKLGRW